MDNHERLAGLAAAASRPRQKGSQQGRWPDRPPKTKPGPVGRQPPASLHGLQPLCCLSSPARVRRQPHAHEPHRPTADAHGTAGPLIGQATASPAPAQDVARRILESAWWAGFTFNGITAYGDGHDSLIGGLVNHPVHRCALRRTDQNGKVAAMPRPWTLRQTANRASTTTGMGSGLLRLKRPGAEATATAPEARATVALTMSSPLQTTKLRVAPLCWLEWGRCRSQRLGRQQIHQRCQGLGAVMVRCRRSVGLGGASSWRRNWSKRSGETACQACCTSSSRAALRAACRTKSVRVRPGPHDLSAPDRRA